MASFVIGELEWNMTRDSEGHRDYRLSTLVQSDVNDGPFVVCTTPGLRAVGSVWSMGNDYDAYAWCRPDMTVTPVVTREPNILWTVDQTFSTRPMERCNDNDIEDPLLEPPDIGGTFTRKVFEAFVDRHGDPLCSSSWELFRGQAVEIDIPHPTVVVTFNSATLPLALATQMLMNPLNDAPLWGLPARCVKFSNMTWSRKLYGTCSFYYTITYDFEVKFDSFDKWVLDEGTRVLAKGGNYLNPKHFIQYKNPHDNEPSRTLLDGFGKALEPEVDAVEMKLEILGQSNLLLLGIPGVL